MKKETKQEYKNSKFHINGNFDFLTTCQKSNLIYCHPCNSALFLQTSASVLFHRYNLVVYLVTFNDTTWKLSDKNVVILAEQCPLERFSFECRKTKTKVITLTNHNSRKQSNEPIRARSKYMSPVPSAGKRARVNHDWFWFYF